MKISLSKNLFAWIFSHAFFLFMLMVLIFDPKQYKALLPYAGYCSVGFLVLTLSLNPLIKVRPFLWALFLNRYRRQWGVASFSYALLHVACYVIKRVMKGLLEGKGWSHFFHPSLLPVLLVGFPLLFALAMTSNQYSMKKLTFLGWKKLHEKIYWVEGSIILHMTLTGNGRVAFLIFLPLIALQMLRKYKAS